MQEKNFQTEVINSLKANGAFAYKIPDQPRYSDSAQRFNPPKRFDILAVYSGVPLAIECKFYKEFKGFGLNQFRDEQIDALNDHAAAGGKSFAFLNIRIKKPYENRLLIFDWPWFYRTLSRAGKCIPKNEIELYPFLVGYKSQFPLSNWLNELAVKKVV